MQLTKSANAEAWEHLVGALRWIAYGRVPDRVGAMLRCSRLVPLRKPGGTADAIRPVAVGEVFARFVGRCLCAKNAERFKNFFAPAQFGVATPCGGEMCVKTMIAHYAFLWEGEGSRDIVFLTMDAINAFNSASRGRALLQVGHSNQFRALLPMLLLFYRERGSFNIFENHELVAELGSLSGVRQGDPFGSFLFAFLIHDDLLELHLKFIEKGVLVVAYLDDIFIVGDRALALEAANELATKLALKNLSFGKNKLFSPNPEFARDDATLVFPGLTFFEDECPKFLGAFLGGNAKHSLNDLISGKISDKCRALVEFARQGNAFTALQLPLVCVGSIPNYFLRMMPPSVTALMAESADSLLVNAFLSISGLSETLIAADFKEDTLYGPVLRLQQSQGGIGLVAQTTLAKTAYIASWFTVGQEITRRFPHLTPAVGRFTAGITPTPSDTLIAEVSEGLAQQHAYVRDVLKIPDQLEARSVVVLPGDHSQPQNPATLRPLQQTFAAAEAQRTHSCLRDTVNISHPESPHANVQTKAWFHGLSGLGRAAYLHAPPSRGVKPLSNKELQFAIRRHFRVPVLEWGRHTNRCTCGEHLDPYGDHVDTCQLLTGLRTRRHDIVNERGLMNPAKQVRLNPKREPAGLVDNTRGRPADTLIEASLGMKGAGDAWLCLDVVGCASYADGYAQVSARYPGGSMTQAVGRKNRQTLRLRASVHDLCVIPMAFESQGVLHENWEEIYHLFARHWVQTHRADVDESQRKREASALVRMWTAHTSLTIQRAQYMLYNRMLQYIALPISEEPPHATRTPDEDVEHLARACLPFVESGIEFLPITID